MTRGWRRAGAAAMASCLVLLLPSVEARGEWSDTITELRIERSQWKWNSDLADVLSLKVGQKYRSADAARTLDLLRNTGSFASVDLVTEFGPEGVKVGIELTPKELVADVSVSGNFLLMKKDVRGVVRTVGQEVFDRQEAEKDAQRIRDLYTGHGFFGTEVKLVTSTRPWGIDVEFAVSEGKPGVVQDVSFKGNEHITTAELNTVHKIVGYTYYSPEEVDEAVDLLVEFYRRSGYITAKVSAETSLVTGGAVPSLSLTQPLKSIRSVIPGAYQGVNILFKVQEGSKYDARIIGNREMSEEELRRLITFHQTGFFDQFEAEESRDAILNYYRNNGHQFAAVAVDLNKETGVAVFTVTEGPRVKINSLSFTGNEMIPGSELERLADSRPGTVASKIFRADVLDEDLNRIRVFYVSHGFTRVALSKATKLTAEGGDKVDIIVSVVEGPRAAIGGVTFIGNSILDGGQLLEAMGKLPTYFDPDWVEGAKKKLLDRYGRLGYADCEVNADIVPDQEGRSVNLAFQVREGRQRFMGKIVVVGNRRTLARVITREFQAKEGEPFDPVKIFHARQRLFERGLFSRVDVVNAPPQPSGVTDLIIKVRERGTTGLAVGVGFDSHEKFRGYVEVGEENLLGTGRGIRLKYKLSTIGYRFDVTYQEPWAPGLNHDVMLNLYDEFRREEGYDVERIGGRLFSDFSLSRYVDLYAAYRYESQHYDHIDPELIELGSPKKSYRIGGFQATLTNERRDNVVNPHRGYSGTLDAEIYVPALGSTSSYGKAGVGGAYVLPLFTGSELAFSARAGISQVFRDGDKIPLDERYFTGGANSVRGYEEKMLGPKDASGNPRGGKLMLVGNVEWRFVIWRSLAGTVFSDAGNVWLKPSNFKSRAIRKTVGGGLRYETPVGPVRLEYGYKLDPLPGEDLYRIHFSLGYPF